MSSDHLDETEIQLLADVLALVIGGTEHEGLGAIRTLHRKANARQVTGGALKNLLADLLTFPERIRSDGVELQRNSELLMGRVLIKELTEVNHTLQSEIKVLKQARDKTLAELHSFRAASRKHHLLGFGVGALCFGVVLGITIPRKSAQPTFSDLEATSRPVPALHATQVAAPGVQPASQSEPPLREPSAGASGHPPVAPVVQPDMTTVVGNVVYHWRHVSTLGTRWSLWFKGDPRTWTLFVDGGTGQVAAITVDPAFGNLTAEDIGGTVDSLRPKIAQGGRFTFSAGRLSQVSISDIN